MKASTNKSGAISRFLLVTLFFTTAFFAFTKAKKLLKNQQELQEVIKELKTKEVSQGNKVDQKEVVEKIVRENPWSSLQPSLRDTVVQVFSQIADFNWLQPYQTPGQHQASGSGFFINDQGYLITNAHVVDQAKAISIQVPSLGKEQLDVEIIGISYERDLALLKVTDEDFKIIKEGLGENAPYLKLGDSDKVRRASEIMLLGYPLGQQSLKSTVGVISGRESMMGRQLFQIDAAGNPGNSGGPAVNSDGEVVGILVSGISAAQNVAYMIPVNELKMVLNDLYKTPNKLLRKPFLGVFYNPGSAVLTQYLNNPEPGGCYVVDVYKGSVLDKAGIKAGDMVYEINGYKVDYYGEISVPWLEDKISLVDYVSYLPLGKEVNIVCYRNGERKDFKFKFEASKLPDIRAMYPDYEKIDYEVIGGMVVMQLTRNHLPLLIAMSPELIKYDEPKNQTKPALIITHVLPDSQAQRARVFSPGTTLKEINGMEVKSLEEFRNAVKKSLDNNFLTIKASNDVFVALPLKRVLQDEMRLSQIYRYPVTNLAKELMQKMQEKENENKKTTGSDAAGNVA